MRIYKLEEIFEQASKDFNSTASDGDGYTGYISFGIKIVSDKRTNKFYIYNTASRGDFYDELTEPEYELFLCNGWNFGVYNISLSNYRRKLEVIQSKIRDVVNNSRSEKQLQKLKDQRETIMERYHYLATKLNQIKL